jgi:hypothetical protein
MDSYEFGLRVGIHRVVIKEGNHLHASWIANACTSFLGWMLFLLSTAQFPPQPFSGGVTGDSLCFLN